VPQAPNTREDMFLTVNPLFKSSGTSDVVAFAYASQINPIYELDCSHGENCHKINKCKCTPISQTLENQRIREEQIREIHINNSKNTKRRAQRKMLREQRLQAEGSV
jgi:hypothetical protein